MSILYIQLLGNLNIKRDEKNVIGLEARKAQELLCYIVLHRNRPLPREPLASVLWPDCSTAQSRAYLRKALWQLQSALDDGGAQPSSPNMLKTTADTITLNPEATTIIDAAVLEHAFVATRRLQGKMLSIQQSQLIREAVDLYTSNLLEGWYQDWVLYERDRLQQIYLALLDKLMSYYDAHDDYESSLEYGERILRYERAHEPTYRRMMLLHSLTGNRTAAIRQYERCVSILQEEFNIKPDQQTTELYQQLQEDQQNIALAIGQPTSTQLESTPLLSQMLNRLTNLEQTLNSIHQIIHQDIQYIEHALINRDGQSKS